MTRVRMLSANGRDQSVHVEVPEAHGVSAELQVGDAARTLPEAPRADVAESVVVTGDRGRGTLDDYVSNDLRIDGFIVLQDGEIVGHRLPGERRGLRRHRVVHAGHRAQRGTQHGRVPRGMEQGTRYDYASANTSMLMYLAEVVTKTW